MDQKQVYNRKTVRELMRELGQRPVAVASEGDEVSRLVEILREVADSRILYVLNSSGLLVGTISLGSLVRHLCGQKHSPQIHTRRLMHLLTNETAADLMQHHPVVAHLDEELGDVLKRMLAANIKEMAVLDEAGAMLGDLRIIDLLQYLCPSP